MYWWQRAAELARTGKIRRFGFITTNSLPQVFNRKVVAQNLSAAPSAKLAPLSLIFAIPDHPWLKSALSDGQAATDHAAVRIAMTVGERGEHIGHLYRVKSEGDTSAEGTDVELTEQAGRIFADLRIGSDVAGATPLKSNEDLCCRGVVLHGAGFIVTPEQATSLGLGKTGELEKYIRPYVNGRDLTGRSRNVMVIDLFGMTASEVRKKFPEVYQWVFDHVKSERDQNREPFIRDNWWVFGRPRPELRAPLAGLTRYISTVETAKHRVFVLLDSSILPDNKLVNFALSDALSLGVLSSRIHVSWALASGGHLGVGNDPVYVKTSCFDKFPFPDCSEAAKQTIGEIAERLDAHRKRQQQLHPTLTLTEMYNVLEKLRANEEFTIEDHTIYEMGLIGILREIHDELDEAVFAAYGWSLNLSTEQILAKPKKHPASSDGFAPNSRRPTLRQCSRRSVVLSPSKLPLPLDASNPGRRLSLTSSVSSKMRSAPRHSRPRNKSRLASNRPAAPAYRKFSRHSQHSARPAKWKTDTSCDCDPASERDGSDGIDWIRRCRR
jgi:hypothetical protein